LCWRELLSGLGNSSGSISSLSFKTSAEKLKLNQKYCYGELTMVAVVSAGHSAGVRHFIDWSGVKITLEVLYKRGPAGTLLDSGTRI